MDLESLLSKVADTMNASRSFGPTIERGDALIIPVSCVVGGGGAGVGTPPEGEETVPAKRGEGTGGGFGSVSWPLGVYVVRNDQVRWIPALDATRVAIAAIGLLKLAAKLRSRRRASQ